MSARQLKALGRLAEITRWANSWTLTQVATVAGVAPATVRRVENGVASEAAARLVDDALGKMVGNLHALRLG